MKHKLKRFEIEVTDLNGKGWTFQGDIAGTIVCEPEGFHVVEDFSISNARFHCCDVEPDIKCESLAKAHDRFAQSEINHIQEEAEFALTLEACPV